MSRPWPDFAPISHFITSAPLKKYLLIFWCKILCFKWIIPLFFTEHFAWKHRFIFNLPLQYSRHLQRHTITKAVPRCSLKMVEKSCKKFSRTSFFTENIQVTASANYLYKNSFFHGVAHSKKSKKSSSKSWSNLLASLTKWFNHLVRLAQWLSVRWRTKWFWVWIPLQSLNF